MKKYILFTFLLISTNLIGQDYKKEFEKLFVENKIDSILPHINKWKSNSPNDPEMYIAFFHYYHLISKEDHLVIGNEPKEGDSLSIYDQQKNDPLVYLHSGFIYNDSLFNLSQNNISEGISKHPKRLDMYFGKIFHLKEKGDYKKFIIEIHKVIEKNKTYKDEWLWTNNVIIDDPRHIFKLAIYDYIISLLNAKAHYSNDIEEISLKMLVDYPDEIIFISSISLCKLQEEEYTEALTYLKKAYIIAPTDPIIINNMVATYTGLEDDKNTKKYLNELIKYGSQEDIKYAKESLEKL
jgi:tetratricopeptide (TPR) repeat protein